MPNPPVCYFSSFFLLFCFFFSLSAYVACHERDGPTLLIRTLSKLATQRRRLIQLKSWSSVARLAISSPNCLKFGDLEICFAMKKYFGELAKFGDLGKKLAKAPKNLAIWIFFKILLTKYYKINMEKSYFKFIFKSMCKTC